MYSCYYNLTTKRVIIEELYYIGESGNVCNRVRNHERLDDWKNRLPKGQTLCFSFAPVAFEDRERVEAALIIRTQPPFNTEHKEQFAYNDTTINTNGDNILLPKTAIVCHGETF